MNNIFGKLTLTVAAAAIALSAQAVPAYPGIIETAQPDGTRVHVRLKGDERRNWAESPDGYSLLRNSRGYWTFARLNASGAVEASDIVYRNNPHDAQRAGIRPHIGMTRGAGTMERVKSDLQVDESFPATGNRKLLMLLVNYENTQPVFGQSDFDAMMNEAGYGGIGSFRDYYLEQSYGKLDITTTVTRWVTLPHPKSYYGPEGAINMIRDALTLLDNEINLRDFDNDGDGVLDGLAVIHQGAGQEYTGGVDDIWSHSSSISGMEFDGVQVRRYTMEPELLGTTGRMSTIGVVCHEFGHNLGAPDFYDTDYESSGGEYPGTGVWDLMGSGAWNGDRGDRPAGTNMWQKIQLGWCNPTMLTESEQVDNVPSADSEPAAYRFDTTVPGEYFIMENRQQNGEFDSALPGHGLIIYHVNEAHIRESVDINNLNVSYPQAIYTVCASATTDPDSYYSSYGNVNSDGAPFPGSTGATIFDDNSTPSAKSIDGRNSYKALGNITENSDGTISFTFTAGETPVAPVNLTATARRGIVTLTWELPEGTETPVSFSVYRNAVRIGTTTEMTFVDNSADQISNTYYVDATYANGLVSPYSQTSVRIPSNFVNGLAADVDEEAGTVSLTWDFGTRLSRNMSMESSEIVDYVTPSLDYVHRFSAEDLSIYRGYKIRRIGFMPYQGPRQLKFTLRVWEAEAGGLNPRIISERATSEFGALMWNDLLLSKTVEIDGTKELWIGVHCEASENLVQIITDRSGEGGGRGNWIKIGDGDWQVDPNTTSNYYLRFTLVVPEIGEPTDMPTFDGPVDPAVDLAFPRGFTVYRDDELIGSTGNRIFIDRVPVNGTHLYGVSSCYKGDNESGVETVEVVCNNMPLGFNDPTDEIATGTVITVSGRELSLPAYDGRLTVSDAMGRIIVNTDGYHAGDSYTLAQGVYIVRTSHGASKVLVR